ncbi:probable inactive poly [ADP-ribose] polymerase SRO3 [Fagus crenata]
MSPQNDVARKMVEMITVRVPHSQSPYTLSSLQLLSDCCSSRFMIQNNSNFKRSDAPARFMFYRNGSWINFPNEINFLTENQRSIAWIDENGKCFFPKVFVDEEFAKSEENPKNPKIEIEIRIDIDGNSSKRKRDEFESNSNSNSNEDEAEVEVTSSKKPDEDDTSKRLSLTPEFGVESVGQRRDFG